MAGKRGGTMTIDQLRARKRELLERRRSTVVPGDAPGEYRRKYQLVPLE